MDHVAARRSALRDYLLAVTKELLARGVLRKASGQSIGDVMKAELPEVLRSVREDLAVIGGEMLGGFLGGALQGLLGAASRR